MRCEIIDEQLIVIPENHTEIYAMRKWKQDHPLKEVDVDPLDMDDF